VWQTPTSSPLGCDWINHWSLWRMASATPDLRLPPQPGHQGVLAGTKLYCLVIEAHVCEQLVLKAELSRFEPATFWVTSPTLWPLCLQAIQWLKTCNYVITVNNIWGWYTGWAKKTGMFLRVDNFAIVRGRNACDMSKVSRFCLEQSIQLRCQWN